MLACLNDKWFPRDFEQLKRDEFAPILEMIGKSRG
jgi:hypothetical protein